MYIPIHPNFTMLRVECKGVYITRTCQHDEMIEFRFNSTTDHYLTKSHDVHIIRINETFTIDQIIRDCLSNYHQFSIIIISRDYILESPRVGDARRSLQYIISRRNCHFIVSYQPQISPSFTIYWVKIWGNFCTEMFP